ncbi:MAG TPA: hypothetical protein VFJ15_08770 [Oleiagrimonas sp.]|nr:hypothetical protein [Oleiagrimonas sp.]
MDFDQGTSRLVMRADVWTEPGHTSLQRMAWCGNRDGSLLPAQVAWIAGSPPRDVLAGHADAVQPVDQDNNTPQLVSFDEAAVIMGTPNELAIKYFVPKVVGHRGACRACRPCGCTVRGGTCRQRHDASGQH